MLFFSQTETNYKWAEFMSMLIFGAAQSGGRNLNGFLNSYINETFMPNENSNIATVCPIFVFTAI